MNTDRRTAVTVGIIFIVATAASLVGGAFGDPLLGSPDPLAALAAHPSQAMIAALLTVASGLTSAGIALALYPVLKRYHEGLAIGAVGFRVMEGVFYMVGALCLLTAARAGGHLAGPDASTYRAIGSALLTARDLAGFVFGVLAFSVGAFLYYLAFYRSNLVPRWLSMWGLIAIVLIFAAVLITLFSGATTITGNLLILVLPIALQEMVLAVWLIVKGFNG